MFALFLFSIYIYIYIFSLSPQYPHITKIVLKCGRTKEIVQNGGSSRKMACINIIVCHACLFCDANAVETCFEMSRGIHAFLRYEVNSRHNSRNSKGFEFATVESQFLEPVS